jgi:hypothetical protein
MFYFLLNKYEGPSKANYQHSCVVLGEGLKALNIPFTANYDYYPDMSGTCLFHAGSSNQATYIVTSCPEDHKEEIQELAADGKKLIVIDTKDEWIRDKSLQFMPLTYRYFMSSCSSPTNTVRPFCFATSNRMLDAMSNPPMPWTNRASEIVWAHRVDNHYLRNYVINFYMKKGIKIVTFLDKFEQPQGQAALHYWSHSGRRHSPAYFEALRRHKYLDAHGGYPTKQPDRIVQWDSWKMWEGLLSGCLVITADLDYYGIELPYKLIPYEHYIPIRYHEIEESYKKLFSLPENEQERIALNGQAYARKVFRPESMADYFIKSL